MNYKGSYADETSYNVGDVVVFEDGVAYRMTKEAAAGTKPHDVRYWEWLRRPLQDIVLMFHGTFAGIRESIPNNINDESILLKTDDGEYLITVDDSGDTPELAVTEVEEEGDDT